MQISYLILTQPGSDSSCCWLLGALLACLSAWLVINERFGRMGRVRVYIVIYIDGMGYGA